VSSRRILEAARRETSNLDDIVQTLPLLLDDLRRRYCELEERALYVEEELSRTNHELEERVGELNGLKRHLEAVLESLPCGVIVRDANGCIVRTNEAVERILGLERNELLGATQGAEHKGLLGSEASDEPHEIRRPDGQRRVVANRYSAVKAESGEIAGSVEIVDDRTERASLQERLHAADKLAALGTLSAGVAHELRNPLNAVKGFASLFLRQDFDDDRYRRWASCIVQGVDETDVIIENMLSFGSPQRLRIETVDPTDLLEGAVRLVRSESEGPIRIDFESDAHSFQADRIKLRQAIRNLTANALKVQGVEGQVSITLTREDNEIHIRVADAGPGISAEERKRVMDPFYTTNADGTGLGLPLVAVIARLHGGELELSPEPSPLGGAEFLIRFPFRSSSAEATGFPQAPGPF